MQHSVPLARDGILVSQKFLPYQVRFLAQQGQQRDPPPRGAGWEPTALLQ